MSPAHTPLRVAWFRPDVAAERDFDQLSTLARELDHSWRIEIFDGSRAHDFAWMQARDPFDLCVHELADTPAHAFVWAYLFNYPGLLWLRNAALLRGRAFALDRKQRNGDFRRETTFGGWDLVRAPIAASRLTVVSDDLLAEQLRRDYGGPVRIVPLGFGRVGETVNRAPGAAVRFGLTSPLRQNVLRRALGRARAAGATVDLVADGPIARIVQDADVVLALDWPPVAGDPPVAALAAMSHARAVVALETEGTARWPALDPQTWRSRDLTGDRRPIAVTIDPRDEEHSLALVLRRLASDRALLRRLGDAGHDWWREHATLDHAARGWNEALSEARSSAPGDRPHGWPAHLTADGTGRARAILSELGVAVDFLD